MVYLYFEKLPDFYILDVVDPVAVKHRIANEMQGNRGVITIGARGGRMVIIDTASIRLVA